MCWWVLLVFYLYFNQEWLSFHFSPSQPLAALHENGQMCNSWRRRANFIYIYTGKCRKRKRYRLLIRSGTSWVREQCRCSRCWEAGKTPHESLTNSPPSSCISLLSMLHRRTTLETQWLSQQYSFWQEAIDQDVGCTLIGGFFNAGVSRLSLWGLHLVPSVGSIELIQFLLWCGCRCGRLQALMATLCQPPRRCTKKQQPVMSDKCVNIVKALDHWEWCC